MPVLLETSRHADVHGGQAQLSPMLLSWNSEKDLAAIQAALAVEGEKLLSEAREARTAKWREEVKARGSFY